MSIIEKAVEKNPPVHTRKLIRATKFLQRKVSFSHTTETNGTSLDPLTVRRVTVSLVKHQKAYQYLKDH
jgi:hypothetical protein